MTAVVVRGRLWEKKSKKIQDDELLKGVNDHVCVSVCQCVRVCVCVGFERQLETGFS